MSKTKRCPACQKELPILAVRCKYCGFKLSSKSVEATARESFTSLPPLEEEAPMMRLSSTPPPPPPTRKPSVPPPPPGGAKKTMMMGAVAAPPRPVGMGRAGNATTPMVPDRTTMPPPPAPRPSSPPPPPQRTSSPPPRPSSPPPRPKAPPRPSGPNLDDADLDLGALDADVEEESSWIPDNEEADLSQLMDLDVDDSSVFEVDSLDSDDDGDAQSDDEFFEDDEEAPSFFLFRYMFTDEKLDTFDDKGWPGWLVKIVGKLRWVYALGAAVALLGLILTIVIVAVSGGDEIEIPQTPELAQVQPPQGQVPAVGGVGVVAGGQKPAVEGSAAPTPQPPTGTPELGQPDIAVPTAGKTCRPLAEYPDFPWKDKLEKAVSEAAAVGVCGLFGQTSAKVAGLFSGTPMVGPGGHDSVKGGGLLEVFFAEKATRPGPSMEMLFVGDKLYEVRLNYRETEAKDLGAKGIGEVLESEPESLKDNLGRKITRYVDGDVVVDFVEESWYGRTLKTLVLSSSQVRLALAPGLDNYEKAMSAMASGDGEFGKWKFEGALEKYVEAAETMDTLGVAHVKQALMMTRLEKFEEVEKAARKALQVSTENRVRAEAMGLLAVTALYNGDSDGALAHFREAAETDVANNFFSMSASELESGEYSTARVARTAARMECLKKKTYKSTFRGLLARGNFPDNKTYFNVLKKAMADPKFAKLKKDASRGECK